MKLLPFLFLASAIGVTAFLVSRASGTAPRYRVGDCVTAPGVQGPQHIASVITTVTPPQYHLVGRPGAWSEETLTPCAGGGGGGGHVVNDMALVYS